MHEQIYYGHLNLGAHATIDAINMAALTIYSKRKYLLTLNTSVYIYCAHVVIHFMWGWVVGDMQLMERHLTCNVCGKVYI